MVTTIILVAVLGFLAVWIYNRASGGRVQKRVEGAAEGLERVAADADRRAHEPTPSGVVEYRVSGTVEYILGRVRSFLSSPAWGHRGEEQGVLIPNTVVFRVDPGYKALEVVAWIAVSIVTLGSGIVAWIVYHFIIRDMLLPTVVEGYPTEVSGVARVLVGGPPKYRDSLQEFVASLPTAERVSDSANSALYALHAPHPLSGWGVLYSPTA